MEAKHVYMKGLCGWGLFYRIEDILVFFTVFSVLVRQMKLVVLSFAVMFNHIHSFFNKIMPETVTRFQIRLSTIFTKEYNTEYGRMGPVFNHRYGRARKAGAKKEIPCMAYIFNNPVAGQMCKRAVEYRWNLLAYYRNPHPFSEKLVKRSCRYKMRVALKVVDIYYSEGKYLGYPVLRRIFSGLEPKEKQQMVDYIVSKYNFLDYNELFKKMGDYDNVLLVVDSMAGNEYDMEDEYGNHSNYTKLLAASKALGFEGPNFECLSSREIVSLSKMLFRRVNATQEQMRKFLHIPSPPKKSLSGRAG